MKRTLTALVLTLALAVSLVVPAFAGDYTDLVGEHVSGEYLYDLQEDGTALITAYNREFTVLDDTVETLVIPSELDGHPVTKLGSYAFSHYMPYGIKRIVVPEGVTHIYNNCFECNFAHPTVTDFSLPSTLEYIGANAFVGHTALETIVIPENVTFMGTNVFYTMKPDETHGLKNVIFYAKNVTFEGSDRLYGQTAFTSCRGTTFYGYPGTSLEELFENRLRTYYTSFQNEDGSWSDGWYPTNNEFKDIAGAPLNGTPVEPQPPVANMAFASTQKVDVDGKAVEFQMYALKDAAGNDTNYVKLRDVASVLNGTRAQFQVGWDGAVNIVTGQSYTANGSEMSTPYSGDRAYEANAAETWVNGAAAALDAIVLKDDGGNGYTYYKLRDLGNALGFTVDWTAERGVYIEI